MPSFLSKGNKQQQRARSSSSSSYYNSRNKHDGELRFHDDDDDDDIDNFLEPSHDVQQHHEAESKRKSITLAAQSVPAIVSNSVIGWLSAVSLVVHLIVLIAFIALPLFLIFIHFDFCFKCGGAEFLIIFLMSLFGVGLLLFGMLYPLRQYIIERRKQSKLTQEDIIQQQLEAPLEDMEDGIDFDEYHHDNQFDDAPADRGLTSGKISISLARANSNSGWFKRFFDISEFLKTSKKEKAACCVFSTCSIASFIWLAVTIIVFLTFIFFVRSTRVNKSGHIYSSVISGKKVRIEREPSGMVHVAAENINDLAFGQGVAAAQDRLFQMELYKIIGKGSLAEIVGSDALILDKLSHVLGLRKYAEENLANIPKDIVSIIQSYVDGINAYIESGPALSAEFSLVGFKPTKWEVIDVLTFEKLFALQMTYNYIFELARLVVLERGATLERVTELSSPMYANYFTVFNREELKMNITDEEAEEIEKKLWDQSGAYIPSSTNSGDEHVHNFGEMLYEKLSNDKYLKLLLPTKKGSSRGSNNWVVGKSISDSSSGYNVNDPHLDIMAPVIVQQIHLKIVKDITAVNDITSVKMEENTFELIGASFPGLPSVGIGRSAFISWSITLSFSDVQDLYVLTPCPDQPDTHYMVDGKPEEYKIRKVNIKVAGEENVELVVKESRFGPVINDPLITIAHADVKTQKPMALKWTAHLPNDTSIMGLQQMTNAKTMDEFAKATRLLTALPFSIVFTDRNGNIGYSLTGTTPIRQQGHTGMFAMPGDVSKYEYKGYATGDQITVINPPKGYIITANNRITPGGFPYIVSNDNEFDYRAKRIDEMIRNVLDVENRKITQKDMIEAQNDVKSLIYEELKFVLRNISQSLKEDPYAKYVNGLLNNWDGKILRESTHATLFEFFLTNLIKLPEHEVGKKYWNDFFYLRRALSSNDDIACTVHRKQTCQEFAVATFKETVDILLKHFGQIPPWKVVHYIDASHPLLGLTPLSCLSDRKIHSNGGTYTVNINNFVYDKVTETTIPTVNAAVYRQIIGGGEFSNSKIEGQDDLWISPLGQDGNMFSEHYDNFIEKYIEGSYLPLTTEAKYLSDVFEILPTEKSD